MFGSHQTASADQASDADEAGFRGAAGPVLAASFVGTAIEYFDFIIYATATALVIGPAFFPAGTPGVSQLGAFATFAVAFFARPVGAAMFGHFGDRVGRKATLIASLLVMGACTFLIGCLPTYETIGPWAPAALCLLRFGQGLGFGGEWGGAVLLAVENAPSGRRARYGIFPQIGALVGGMLANLCFVALSLGLSPTAFQAWGWRLPFLASAALVGVGLYVRLKLAETPAFRIAMAKASPERVPFASLMRRHGRAVIAGTFAAMVVYTLVYLTSVFTLGYGTKTLGFAQSTFLLFQCVAIGVGIVGIVMSGAAADRFGRRPVLLAATAAAILPGVFMAAMLRGGMWPGVLGFLCLSNLVLGWVFGPLGAALAELFPTRVRYSGVAVTYNLAGILGASGVPYVAQKLVVIGGIGLVGFYLAAIAVVSFLAVVAMPGTRAGTTI